MKTVVTQSRMKSTVRGASVRKEYLGRDENRWSESQNVDDGLVSSIGGNKEVGKGTYVGLAYGVGDAGDHNRRFLKDKLKRNANKDKNNLTPN